jgi:hypothetical protein
MVESIASSYSSYQQAQLMQQVETSVLASAIDSMEQQGESVVELINVSSVSGQTHVFTDPMLGQNVDVLA